MVKWQYSKDNPAYYKTFKPLRGYGDKKEMHAALMIVLALISIIILLIIRFISEI